ncbi:MAG: nucleotide sugar dehydrogenase [Verrucomicrobiia bacterium]
MRVTILGLWHLGSVTAACCSEHFETVGLDFDPKIINDLQQGKAPIAEPGLNDLIASGLQTNKLRFTTDIADACNQTDILWVCYDTPVDENDVANVDFVLNGVQLCLPSLPSNAVILISSQLPVGTAKKIESWPETKNRSIAVSPENLRLGQALEVFRHPDRVIIGARNSQTHTKLELLFAPFSKNIIKMKSESAEMVKHALNGFLALSVTYINEISRLCEKVGADAKEVEKGLKTDLRIGPRSYLSPGPAFAGGTLARDVVFLSDLGNATQTKLELIPSIKQSNDHHRLWPLEQLKILFPSLNGKNIALLGLTYKPGTDTLRRSSAIELAHALQKENALVQAFDPAVNQLPEEFLFIRLKTDIRSAIKKTDAIIICTPWSEFKALPWSELIPLTHQPIIIDAYRFLIDSLQGISKIRYFTVGSCYDFEK